MEKKQVLLTNLLVKQGNCDSFCKYCYHNREEGDAGNSSGNNSGIISVYSYAEELKENLDRVLDFSERYFQSPIIKICGGEIFLMTNLKEFVEKLLETYPYVLIQTNGKHLNDETLKWIVGLKRVMLQISMDGHLLCMNRYRFDTQEVLDRLLYALGVLKENDVYVELTSVLNKLNTERYSEFLEYLDQIPGGTQNNSMKATPILLIDKTNEFKAGEEAVKKIEELTMPNKYEHILPPLPYMKNLYRLMRGERIKYRCYNPLISVNYLETGEVKGCTNILPEEELNVGNIFLDREEDIVSAFGKTKLQRLLVETEQWMPLCKKCFNFCSIYNLYLNDTLTLDELCDNNFMFTKAEVRNALKTLKQELKRTVETKR